MIWRSCKSCKTFCCPKCQGSVSWSVLRLCGVLFGAMGSEVAWSEMSRRKPREKTTILGLEYFFNNFCHLNAELARCHVNLAALRMKLFIQSSKQVMNYFFHDDGEVSWHQKALLTRAVPWKKPTVLTTEIVQIENAPRNNRLTDIVCSDSETNILQGCE